MKKLYFLFLSGIFLLFGSPCANSMDLKPNHTSDQFEQDLSVVQKAMSGLSEAQVAILIRNLQESIQVVSAGKAHPDWLQIQEIVNTATAEEQGAFAQCFAQAMLGQPIQEKSGQHEAIEDASGILARAKDAMVGLPSQVWSSISEISFGAKVGFSLAAASLMINYALCPDQASGAMCSVLSPVATGIHIAERSMHLMYTVQFAGLIAFLAAKNYRISIPLASIAGVAYAYFAQTGDSLNTLLALPDTASILMGQHHNETLQNQTVMI